VEPHPRFQQGSRPRPDPGPVYALADAGTLGEEAVPAAVAALAEAGVRWIQIRAKHTPDAELFSLVEHCFRRLEPHGADAPALWMDDRADLATLFPFAGLHLGQRDLPPAAARRVVGPDLWIGASSHNDEELEAALADPEVDVVAVGPVFATTGKENPDPVVGLDFVRRARRATDRPLVAIGGIDADNLAQVLAAGADTAAVLGAICRREGTGDVAADVAANARRLQAAATPSLAPADAKPATDEGGRP